MVDGRDGDREKALAKIAEVRSRFLAGLHARLEKLSALARTAGEPGPLASAAREELRLGLHNLAGSAPTLGLLELGRRAAAIERRVIDDARPDGGLDAALAADIAAETLRLETCATET